MYKQRKKGKEAVSLLHVHDIITQKLLIPIVGILLTAY